MFNRSLLTIAFSLAVAIGLQGCSNNTDNAYSEGRRVGTVTKFSKEGWFTKSWEGELSMDNYVKIGDDGTSNTFSFSVKDEDTAAIRQVDEALNSHQRVALSYKQVNLTNLFASESSYFVKNVLKIK